jgi:hypothetical protein
VKVTGRDSFGEVTVDVKELILKTEVVKGCTGLI